MRQLLFLVFILGAGMQLKAQYQTDLRVIDEEARYSREKKFKTWTLSAGFGPNIMFADLKSYSLFPNNNLKYGWSASIAKQLYPSFAFELQFMKADMFGQKGNFYYEGDFMDYTLNLQTYINQMFNYPGPLKDRWNFYLKMGIGMQAFRSRLHNLSDGSVVKVSEFSGEAHDQRHVVLGYDKKNPEKKITRHGELVIPMGAGMLYRINNNFDIGLESTIRFSYEDKLDNILLGSTNDRYWYSAVTINYNFGKKKVRHSKWTYRSYGFNIFGKPKKDPLLSEIEDLADQIKSYEANRPVKRDSVFIHTSLKKIYGRHLMYQIFFMSYSEDIDRSQHDQLAHTALRMMENPTWKVELIGFSDENEGSDNMKISEERCKKVADKLINDLGMDSNRIIITPKGNNELLSPTDVLTPRGHHFINRRVDIVFRKH